MKKQLFLATLAVTSLTQASDPAWYRVDKKAVNLWNNYGQTVTDAVAVGCAVKPEVAAQIVGNVTERVVTLNGKRNTPNVWDGADGKGGVKSWIPAIVTTVSIGRLAHRWHQANNRTAPKVTVDVDDATNEAIDLNLRNKGLIDADGNPIARMQQPVPSNNNNDDSVTKEYVNTTVDTALAQYLKTADAAKFLQNGDGDNQVVRAGDLLPFIKTADADKKYALADHNHEGMATQNWANGQFARKEVVEGFIDWTHENFARKSPEAK